MRARNLKPGFFKNYQLAQIARPWGRLLFGGLWTLADKEGRLKDEPEWIRAEIFPYENHFLIVDGKGRSPEKNGGAPEENRIKIVENGRDVQIYAITIDEMLDELQNANNGKDPFIKRYQVDGYKYIQILNFSKHQHPHIKEPNSTIPPPNKHQKDTKRTRCLSGEKTSDSPFLDSPFLDSTLQESFTRFWGVYPKKEGKGYAYKIWKKIKPTEDLLQKMISTLKAFKQTERWQRENGRYIPHPSTWLNQGRWEDEVTLIDDPKSFGPEKRWLEMQEVKDEAAGQKKVSGSDGKSESYPARVEPNR